MSAYRTTAVWAGDLDEHPGAAVIRRMRLEIATDQAYAALLSRCWYPMPGPPERSQRAPEELCAAVRRLHRAPDATVTIRYAPHGLDVFAGVEGRWSSRGVEVRWSTACLPYGGAS